MLPYMDVNSYMGSAQFGSLPSIWATKVSTIGQQALKRLARAVEFKSLSEAYNSGRSTSRAIRDVIYPDRTAIYTLFSDRNRQMRTGTPMMHGTEREDPERTPDQNGPDRTGPECKKVFGRISTPTGSQKLSIEPYESSRRDLAF